jgi:peptidylprolyl isomerase
MHKEPLEFTVGTRQLVKGFDNAVIGMKIGEEKEIKITPDEAYGAHNPEFVKDIPRDCFPVAQDIQPSMMFMVALLDSRQIPVRVIIVVDDIFTINSNPPLAGKTLLFKIKITEIRQKEQIKTQLRLFNWFNMKIK